MVDNTNTKKVRADNASSPDLEATNMHSKTMTVSEAKKVFGDFGLHMRGEFESIVTVFREHGICDAVSNSSYLHALILTDLMFRHTSHSFSMVTGCAGDGFLTSLSNSFRKMLFRIKDARGTARIVFLDKPEPKNQCFDNLRKEFAGTLSCISALSSGKVSHFMVCDQDMVRDEDLHKPLTPDSSAHLIKARVYFRNKPKASAFSMRFDSLWNALTPEQAK